MKLSIYSLNQTLFDGDIRQLIAKTAVGELTILDNHIPLLVPLVLGILQIKTIDQGGVHEETIRFRIGGGFLEVKPRGRVIVLADVAESK